MADKPTEKISIDILEIEVTGNLGHWLSPEEKYRHQNDERRDAIRKKHRDRWLAKQRAKDGDDAVESE